MAEDPAIVESPLTEANLLLYADALEHMVDFMGGSSADTQQRLIRRATVNAYNRLFNETDWRYLYKHGRVHLVPSYSTGTIAFTFSTLTVTLMSGTWPAWAKYGRLMINSVVYAVAQRVDNTTLLLRQPECPDADISSGTSYILYRNCYPLASDFKRLLPPSGEKVRNSMYISPEEFVWLERQRRQAGTPVRWTIMGNPDRNGEYAIFVYGYPTVTPSETLDFLYQRTSRPIRRTGYDAADYAGTLALSSTAVTGTATAFTADMVGSYMRLGLGTTAPDGNGGLSPFYDQRKIYAVGSATGITLDSAPSGTTYTATTPYRISDPLDFPQYMHNAFFRCLEWQYAMLTRMQDADNYFTSYQRELVRARECDSVVNVPMSLGDNSRYGTDIGGWRSPLGSQVG